MPQKLATEQFTITDWVKGLAAIPVREFTLENVQDYVIRHGRAPRNAREVLLFFKGLLYAQSNFQE